MGRIPFRVSARAARLIGRENVATSQGAVTELVKNSYDADAKACVILFLRRHTSAPASLSVTEFVELARVFPNAGDCYLAEGDRYQLSPELDANDQRVLSEALDQILDLWIIDNGSGMTTEILERNWMVIGTDAKEVNVRSVGGRVVTGAKGIGRFALDRLGQECELFSGQEGGHGVVHWLVNWGDFEGDGKILDDVTALIETEPKQMSSVLESEKLVALLPLTGPVPEGSTEGEPLRFEHGTAIKISELHDRWDARDTIKLKGTLEALLPPKDRGDFNIYVYDHRAPEQSGWIDNSPPDQFDYRLTAKIDHHGNVAITLDRHEIDVPQIRPTTFTLPDMQEEGFRKEDFEKGSISYTKSLRELLRLKKDEDDAEYLAIGPFDFTMYYMKLSNPTADNLIHYPQKSFDATKRRRWMSNAGGIRLYRDQFRVRPYGEPNTQGSDWLLLGQRVAANPAPASRLGWRVPPQQVAGTIHITKAQNPLLSDQSNREGIMDERAFATFRRIILALIGEFERDRSYIYRNFDLAFKEDNKEEQKLEQGISLAANVLAEAGTERKVSDAASGNENTPPATPTSREDTITLAEALTTSSRRNEALKDEAQVLRGMATLGTVLVSFTHELKQIKANMSLRQTRMENALNRVVDPALVKAVPKQVDPYQILERWTREDEKVSRWVDFALSSVSPQKRRRRRVKLPEYLENLRTYWKEFVDARQIELKITVSDADEPQILAHEIDLDSIFYNLIVNSIEVFSIPGSASDRSISIEILEPNGNEVTILYQDSGSGLSDLFKRPDEIFNFGISSKSETSAGDITGTGIGMWLLKSIIDDYGGRVSILSAIGERGFRMAMTFPRTGGHS